MYLNVYPRKPQVLLRHFQKSPVPVHGGGEAGPIAHLVKR